MKKLIILLLVFLPLFSWGQMGLNPDIHIKGGIDVVGSDTLMLDSITGVGSTSFKLINVDFNITLGYYPILTKSKLILFGKDTIYINTLFQNYNYADSLFTKIQSRTINSDSTELLPERITEIGFFNTALTGANKTLAFNYYSVPPYALTGVRTVCASGCDNTSFDAAITAASANDTIYGKNGYYTEDDAVGHNLLFDKTVTIIGVGNVVIKPTTSAARAVNMNVTSELRNVTIDGDNATQDVIFVQNGATAKVSRCILKNSAGGNYVSVYTNSSAAVMQLSKSVLIANGQNYIFRPTTNFDVSELYITGSLAVSIGYAALRTPKITYSKIDVTNSNYLIELATGFGADIRFSNITLSGTTPGLIRSQSGNTSSNVPVIFKGCTITSAVPTDVLYYIPYGVYISTIENCTINTTSASQANNIIQLSNQSNTLIEDCYINSPNSTSTHSAIVAASTGTDMGYFHVYNNKIHHRANSGYSIGIGTESSGAGDNMIDVVISGNEVLGSRYYDTTNTTITTHGIWVGFQNNCIMRYNNVNGSGINFVVKANSANYNAYIHHNLSINARIENYYSKAFDSCYFYHNTSANFLNYAIIHFYFSQNSSGSGADNNKMINNIAYDAHNIGNLIYCDTASLTGFVSNYNTLYRGANFTTGIANYNFAQWQALGYDANSFNSDPQFKSSTNLTPKSSSPAKNSGLYIAGFNTQLAKDPVFPDPATKVMGSTVDMGAIEPENAQNYFIEFNTSSGFIDNAFIELE